MVKLRNVIQVSPEEMRAAYCGALVEEARKNEKIVALDCDLSNSCGTKGFKKAFPDRAFNLGIQEQNAWRHGRRSGESGHGTLPAHLCGVCNQTHL